MKKEELIQKWLDNELNAQELEAFKQLEEYDDYVKISENAKSFQAPEFEVSKNYGQLQGKLFRPEKSHLSSMWLKIAAVFVLGFGAYFAFFHSNENMVKAFAGTTEEVVLPDGSRIVLNASSSLSYNPEDWKQNRIVHLQGEAYFKVAKGEQFDVVTPAGTISVLGTQFNVKQRPEYFGVRCFEGLVSVKTTKDTVLLPAGKSFRSIQNNNERTNIHKTEPSWIHGTSSFRSIPFDQVIAELERQYNIRVHIKTRTFDINQLFTGSFAHNNLEMALQSVTVPFNLAYQLKKDVIILKVRD